jgi:NAD+ diphosphatase
MCVLMAAILPDRHDSRVDTMLAGPLPDYSFSGAVAHDRLGERRRDEHFLRATWHDEQTRVLVLRGRDLAVEPHNGRLRVLSPQTAPAGQRMLLGSLDGSVYYLVLVDDAEADTTGTDGEYAGLRSLATQLDDHEAALAVHAVSLGGWHQRHPRCSVCGNWTEVADAGASRQCPVCSTQHFPRTDPAVIMLIVDDDDRCLLGHNSARPEGWYSTLAGFVEPGESPEQAVRREVMEETGIRVGDVTYAGSQPWPFPSSLMLGYFGRALSTEVSVDGDEITSARWFTREEMAREMAAGDLGVPTTISIAGALVTRWYGSQLPTPHVG